MTTTYRSYIAVFIIVLSLLQAIIGCEQQDAGDQSVIDQQQLLNELENLKAQNISLKDQLVRYEIDEMGGDPESDTELFEQLQAFRSLQFWDELTLSNNDSHVTITDPKLLEAISPLLIMDSLVTFTNGHPYNIEPFTVTLSNGKGTYTFDVLATGIVAFPDFGQHYISISSDFTALGKALLPKPAFIPEESRESRILNSTFAHIKQAETSFYFISEARVRGIAIAFLQGKKHIITKPDTAGADLLVEIDFLLYGEKITMKVYENYIALEDADDHVWYEVDKFVSGQIQASISAN